MTLTKEDIGYFKEHINRLIENPDIQKMNAYIQHGDISCLEHCISVAYLSFYICKKLHLSVDYKSLVRGAILHDYFLYDWHIKDKSRPLHGFYHPKCAYKNAREIFVLTAIEKDIILKHMWPLTILVPLYKESFIICMADKICTLFETFHARYFIPVFLRN